jgi:hypothetical protein
MLTTPVVLIIFRRPDTTQKVFDAIRKVAPTQLFVIADGARRDRDGEAEKCAATRAIIDQVDWDCQVLTNYSEQNLGCGRRVYTGLNWVFEQVEEAIILEDDCLPHVTFFEYCQELLERYRYDHRIFSISAQDFTQQRFSQGYSYYFSHYPHSWGWATWRRAWQHCDLDLKLWNQLPQAEILYNVLQDTRAVRFWLAALRQLAEGRIDTWDFQWLLCSWLQNGLSIHPNVNLVTNIGFGQDATHTFEESRLDNLPLAAMSFPMTHPPFMMRHVQADQYLQQNIYDSSYIDQLKLKVARFKRRLF